MSVLVAAVLCVFAAACDNADNGATGADMPIDHESMLNSLEDVRALVRTNSQGLDPMVIAGVSYESNELRVRLDESQDGLDTTGLQSACDNVSRSISLRDLRIVVEKANGGESAECRFTPQ